MSHLSAEIHRQANMVNSAPPEYPASPITGTADLVHTFLTENQELMLLISAKGGKSGRKNTNMPPTLSPALSKYNLVIQCPHISINIAEHMGKAATRVAITTPRHPDTSTRPQWISGWT